MKKVLFGLLSTILVQVFLSCFAADENVWLHVEGRYIKTVDGKNFVPAGLAYIASDTVYFYPEDILSWCKKLRVNTIRVSMREETYKDDVDKYMTEYVDPIVQACRLYGIYAFLDAHSYFHEYLPADSDCPRGPLWSQERVQKWVDNWTKTAGRYKDEPWVLGYELLNEPYDISGYLTCDYYMRAIKAIRAVDKKHIILVGTCQWTNATRLEETWSNVKFRPDEPYNQVIFAFHGYEGPSGRPGLNIIPIIDRVLKQHDVPILCTEFESADPEIFKFFKERQIGWELWRMQGTYPDIHLNGEDIWQPALADQATPTLVQMKGKIECSSSAKSFVVGSETPVEINATLKDLDGKPVTATDNFIKFVAKGDGILKGENPVKMVNGTAAIKLKINKPGRVNIFATAIGFYHDKVLVDGKPDKAVKIICKAEPSNIPASGKSVTKITAYKADAYGNQVDSDISYRVNCGGTQYIDSKGQLWLADQTYTEGSWGYTKEALSYDTNEDYKIANTSDAFLYYTARQMIPDGGYRFNVPNGKYKVELFFAETWFGVKRERTKGARVSDIIIEGETRIKNLDVCAKVGSLTAYSRSLKVEVKDGVLDIFADNKADFCEIRAISVTPLAPVNDIVNFSFSGAGKLEGTNPVITVGGKAVINLIPGKTAGTSTIIAAYPFLTSGLVEVTSAGK